MALPEIARALSLFIHSRFHGAAVVASLLFRQNSEQEVNFEVVWVLPCVAPPSPAQRRTRRRPVELQHGLFVDQFPISAPSCPQHRSVAASPQRSCMFRPRKEKWGLRACEIGQGPPLGCFPRGDAGMAARAQLSVGPRLRSTPGFRIFNHRLLDGHWPKSGMARHPLKNAPSSRASCCHPWTDLTDLDGCEGWQVMDSYSVPGERSMEERVTAANEQRFSSFLLSRRAGYFCGPRERGGPPSFPGRGVFFTFFFLLPRHTILEVDTFDGPTFPGAALRPNGSDQ